MQSACQTSTWGWWTRHSRHSLISRRELERHLKQAAALLELHKHKGIPWEPSDHGFVFSKHQVEAFAQRLMRLNESRHLADFRAATVSPS
jgi:hypothetical protein